VLEKGVPPRQCGAKQGTAAIHELYLPRSAVHSWRAFCTN
jgi:hypothetical protein